MSGSMHRARPSDRSGRNSSGSSVPAYRRTAAGCWLREGAGREADLWVHESDRAVLRRLTFDDLEETGAIWSPDGRQIAFVQRRSPELKLLSLDGGSPPRTIYTSDGPSDLLDWSRDGRYLLLQDAARGSRGAAGRAGAAEQGAGLLRG